MMVKPIKYNPNELAIFIDINDKSDYRGAANFARAKYCINMHPMSFRIFYIMDELSNGKIKEINSYLLNMNGKFRGSLIRSCEVEEIANKYRNKVAISGSAIIGKTSNDNDLPKIIGPSDEKKITG
ncbi:hypothetical protein M0R01_03770 [bacterium]|nr:hypothetical protein [bacterium]